MRCEHRRCLRHRRSPLDLNIRWKRLQRQSDARDWFDGAWETLGCEPLRPSGKCCCWTRCRAWPRKCPGLHDTLSNAPRKPARFMGTGHSWRRPRITVDLPGLTVGYGGAGAAHVKNPRSQGGDLFWAASARNAAAGKWRIPARMNDCIELLCWNKAGKRSEAAQ